MPRNKHLQNPTISSTKSSYPGLALLFPFLFFLCFCFFFRLGFFVFQGCLDCFLCYYYSSNLEKEMGAKSKRRMFPLQAKNPFPTELADSGKVGYAINEHISSNLWQITTITFPAASQAQHSPKTLKSLKKMDGFSTVFQIDAP